jgi:hypothetical protein
MATNQSFATYREEARAGRDPVSSWIFSWHLWIQFAFQRTIFMFHLSSTTSKGTWPPMDRIVLSVTAILFALTGCVPAPESPSNATPGPAVPAGNHDLLHYVQDAGRPEVTAEKIMSDIVGREVQVFELTGAGPATEWTFEADEFRQADILERQMAGNELTVVIFMTTRNNPRPDEDDVQVSGKLRLQYEWRAGQWILTTLENLTFRYSLGQST